MSAPPQEVYPLPSQIPNYAVAYVIVLYVYRSNQCTKLKRRYLEHQTASCCVHYKLWRRVLPPVAVAASSLVSFRYRFRSCWILLIYSS